MRAQIWRRWQDSHRCLLSPAAPPSESLLLFQYVFSRERDLPSSSSRSSAHSRRAAFRTTDVQIYVKEVTRMQPRWLCIMRVPRDSFFTNLLNSVFLAGVFPAHASLSFLPHLLSHEYASFPENGAQTLSVCNTQTCRPYVKSSARYGAL